MSASRGRRASRSAGAGANVSRRSVHAKPRIRGSFVALAMERHGGEGRAGAQERARMSVGDLFTPSLGFAEVSWRWSATGMTQGLV